MHPACVSLNLATDGNHITLVWFLDLSFFLGGKEGIKSCQCSEK